jgi:hypothetical protein
MRAPALAVSLALTLIACSRTPADPVRALVDELAAAAEARDADRFGDRLSKDYAGAGMGRADSLATLRRYLAAYESVGVEIYSFEAERDGGTARVRCEVDFSGNARKIGGLEGLLPPSAVYRFELEVADEGDAWRVKLARWEEVPPAAEP